MYNPKYLVRLEKTAFNSDVVCLGSQLKSVIEKFGEIIEKSCVWFCADIDAFSPIPKKLKLNSIELKRIDRADLINLCENIEQFLSGVFIAVAEGQQNLKSPVHLETEDERYRPLDLDGVLIEIRAFDTSYFEIYSEDAEVIKKFSKAFSIDDSGALYTWNDLVMIKRNAPSPYEPGKIAFICGMTKIKFDMIAKKYHSRVGDWIYTVEFGDGSSIEIPEQYLEKCPETTQTQRTQTHRKLRRHDLDFEPVENYVRANLQNANTLSSEILKCIDFRQGAFFTLLPEDFNLDRLYEFQYGGILPQQQSLRFAENAGTYSEIPNVRDEIADFVTETIKKSKSNVCVFDDVIRGPKDPAHGLHLNVHRAFCNSEVYYLLKKGEESPDAIRFCLRNSNAVWHSLCVLTTATIDLTGSRELTSAQIHEICEDAQMIIVGAYDSEGYLIWQKN